MCQAIGIQGGQTQVLMFVQQTLTNWDSYQAIAKHFLFLAYTIYIWKAPGHKYTHSYPILEHISYLSHVSKWMCVLSLLVTCNLYNFSIFYAFGIYHEYFLLLTVMWNNYTRIIDLRVGHNFIKHFHISKNLTNNFLLKVSERANED